MSTELQVIDENRPMLLEGKTGYYKAVRIKIPIPMDMLVSIGKKKITEDGKEVWIESHMLESPLWDTIGRMMGISYINPAVKFEDRENVRLEVTATYFNEYGAVISDTCEYHNDCRVIYEKMRMDWKPKWKWLNGNVTELENPAHAEFPKKEVTYDEKGMPIIRVVLPADIEFELNNNLLTLIRNRHKKAETCCRRSLVQRAVGKKLAKLRPGDKNPMIEITRFVPVATKQEAEQALEELVGDIAVTDELASPPPPPPQQNSSSQDIPSQCTECKKSIDEDVEKYSKKHFGRSLCRVHQAAEKGKQQ